VERVRADEASEVPAIEKDLDTYNKITGDRNLNRRSASAARSPEAEGMISKRWLFAKDIAPHFLKNFASEIDMIFDLFAFDMRLIFHSHISGLAFDF